MCFSIIKTDFLCTLEDGILTSMESLKMLWGNFKFINIKFSFLIIFESFSKDILNVVEVLDT